MARYQRLDQIADQLETEIEIAVAESINNLLNDVSIQLERSIEALLKKIGSKFTGYRSYQQDANEKIAAEMRSAVLKRYDDKREEMRRFRDAAPDYRAGTGRLGGSVLRSALSGEGVAKATYDGIAFINAGILNEAAGFWRRLNFGSGNGTGSLPPIRFTVFGQSFATGTFRVQKGPQNRMPPGLWFTPQGTIASSRTLPSGDTFAPIRSLGEDFHTVRNIQAWDFLDAGIERFNEVAGPIYEEMVQRIIQRSLGED